MRPLITVCFTLGCCIAGALASAETTEMVRIAAGVFIMGSQTGDRDERPRRTVRLPAFEIDREEVTEAAYARCIAAGVCRRRALPLSRSSRLPVTFVSWIDARRYCRYLGKRLPSEAEWERAARGVDGRRFPWGAGLDCRKANFGSFDGDGPCAGKNPSHPVDVGSYPRGASPSGALDMAGNVWEWVIDRYHDRGAKNARNHPPRRVLRGGSCCSYFAMPTTSNRYRLPERAAAADVGFRCARSPGSTSRRKR